MVTAFAKPLLAKVPQDSAIGDAGPVAADRSGTVGESAENGP
jgi:hypothetical protein